MGRGTQTWRARLVLLAGAVVLLAACFAEAPLQVPPAPDCGTSCGDGEACVQGVCFPTQCAGSECGALEICQGGRCTPAACVAVACAEGEGCAAGVCYPTRCASGSCAEGKLCIDGSCEDARCTAVTCPDESACAQGRCFPRACAVQTCPAQTVCWQASCVEPACAGVTCAPGQGCQAGACSACAADFYEEAGACLEKRPLGGGCASAGQCLSGFCADGVCCEAACDGPCQVCGGAGACATASVGEPDPACGAYRCAAAGACATSCSGPGQCRPGASCVGGICEGSAALGAPCVSGGECASGFCADLTCCQAACAGPCDVCDQPGQEGSCVAASAGTAGQPSCAPYLCSGASGSCASGCAAGVGCSQGFYCEAGTCAQAKGPGTSCASAEECLSSHCVDGTCCDTACGGACDACDRPGALGTCGPLAAGSAGNPACVGSVCDGTSAGCPGGCAQDSSCANGFYCGAGSCQAQRAVGAGCARGPECVSGHCVDGYCCDSACAGACDTCGLSGQLGTCTLVAAGASGLNPSCSPYLCDGVSPSCPASCTADAGCVAGSSCAGGACTGKKGDGAVCAAAGECLSGWCVDGYCCDSVCGAACDECGRTGALGSCGATAAGGAASPSCGPYLCDGTSTGCPTGCSLDSQCAGGFYCAGGSCEPKKPLGSSCVAGLECASAHCADGRCCDTGCGSSCASCDRPGALGACGPLSAGSSGSPPCVAYLCDGSAATCPTSCTLSSDCAAGRYCDGGECLPKKATGIGCAEGGECTSGHCADGVCCNAPCSASCDVCNKASAPGICSPVAAGAAGTPSCGAYLCDGAAAACPASCTLDSQCAAGFFCGGGSCQPKKAGGSGCVGAGECASGFCADGVCCDSVCGASCDRCDKAGAVGACSAAAAGVAGTPSCGAYLCNGAATGCPAGCTLDSHCSGGNYCGGGSCVPQKAAGSPCGAVAECASGHCIDGYCCNNACGGACDRCNLAGQLGQCTLVGAGTAGANPSCSPYLCAGGSSSCPASCTGDPDCVAGSVCLGSACSGKKGDGAACGAPSECSSNFCVDGYCCNAPCAASCDLCNKAGALGTCSLAAAGVAGNPTCGAYLCNGAASACPGGCTAEAQCAASYFCGGGTCQAKKALGASCGAANECTSGNCADGTCCDAACTASCDLCNKAGALGTCSPVAAGAAGSPACGATVCDGASSSCPAGCSLDSSCASGYFCSAGTCQPKKAAGLTCTGANECSSGHCADATCCNDACTASCDVCNKAGAQGTCSAAAAGASGSPSCGAYLCSGTSTGCPTNCALDAHCAASYYCGGGVCQAKKATGTGCGVANECTSGFCANGYCCNSGCAASCDVCNKAGALGTCSPAAAGAAGSPSCGRYLCDGTATSCPVSCTLDSDCAAGNYCGGGTCQAKKATSSACAGASECTSGYCVDGYCCDSGCGGSCDLCDKPGARGTCTAFAAGAGGSPSCSPYVCDGASGSCPASCADDSSCASGSYCGGGVCQAKKATGSGCGAANECTTGFCADATCCNAACSASCDVCNGAGALGSCSPAAVGTTGSPSCGGILCNGTSTSCPASCTLDSHCASGYFCGGGTCQAKRATGAACGAANECTTGYCIDSYCCNAGCAASCDVCNKAGALGSCSPAAVGATGSPTCGAYLCDGASATCPASCTLDAHCASGYFCGGGTCQAKKATGNGCGGANECTSGFCADNYCCNSACAASCDVCNKAGALGTCSTAAAGTGGSPSCSPYLCSGSSTSCPTTCGGDPDCVAGQVCLAGACSGKKGDGALCGGANECTSGFCVDGYCCDAGCTASCDQCNKAGALGTCSPAAVGAPGSPSCAAYLCNGASTSCPASCTLDSQCASGHYCGGGTCQAKKATGLACGAANECTSGFCVDSYCCNNACAASCDLCNKAGALGACNPAAAGSGGSPSCGAYLCNGTSAPCPAGCTVDGNCAAGYYCGGGTCQAKKATGLACAAANECTSGFCADNYCCSAACSASCDLCNKAGALGTCNPAAAGSGGNPSCGAYLCNGTSASCPASCTLDAQCASGYFCGGGTCQAKKATGTGCGAANECTSGYCVDGYCCNAGCTASCDVCNKAGALGTCSTAAVGAPGNPTCGAYLCNGSSTSCPASCTLDTQCASGYYCGGGTCQAKKTTGTGCSAANECTSGYCVNGYCCNAACTASCDVCNKAGAPGICSAAAAGASGSPSCGAYLCDGTSTSCPASCTLDAQCASGYYCGAGICRAKKATGLTCGAANECSSGFCVNGYCCSAACTASCDVCDKAGALGACSPATVGSAGSPSCGGYLCNGTSTSCPSSCTLDTQCSSGYYCGGGACQAKKASGTSCGGANECVSGYCVNSYCCNAVCGAACDVCNKAGALGTCSPASAGSTGNPSCGLYLCDGTATSCPTTCSTGADCATGSTCCGGICSTGTCCVTGDEDDRAMWVWWYESSKKQELLDFIALKGVDTVYVNSEWLMDNDQPALTSLLADLGTRGVKLEMLFGRMEWALAANHAVAVDYARRSVVYVNGLAGNKPVGLHYDVEPYSLAEWTSDRNGTANQYLDMLQALKAELAGSGLKLVTDEPFWYDGVSVTRASQTRPLHQWVFDIVDGVTMMDYRDFAVGPDGIINNAATEFAYAETLCKPLVIGVETLRNLTPELVSFAEEGEAVLTAETLAARNYYRSYRALGGDAVHYDVSWKKLSSGSPPIVSGVAANSQVCSPVSVFTWTTNTASDSRVEYGTTPSYGTSSAITDTGLEFQHLVSVTGLAPGVLHYYRVHSVDGAGLDGGSGQLTFTPQVLTATSFADDFDAGTAGDWTPVLGSWAVESGEYSSNNGSVYSAKSVAGCSWGNVTVQARVKLLSGADDLTRVLFRYVDASNFSAVYLSKYYGVVGIEQVSGGVRSANETTITLATGTWYTVRAVANGNQASVYLDGVLKRTWTLPNGSTSGRIGLGTSASHVHFDDVAATSP